MAKIEYQSKACIIKCTQAEWEDLRTTMYSEEYNFPEHFEHPLNDEKLLPEFIIDLIEVKDIVSGMDKTESLKEQLRHLTAVAVCLNMEVREISDYGILQIYFEEE